MNKVIIWMLSVALISQCLTITNMHHRNAVDVNNVIDSLTVIYDPEICPGEVEKYVARSAEVFLSYADLPQIVEKEESAISSFIYDLSKSQNSNSSYIDTDLAVFIHKHNSIDTLILGPSPISNCNYNSEHLYCPEAYLDIVEIVMRHDEEWGRRYVNELKILRDYYLDSEEIQLSLGNRVRDLIKTYE